MKKLILVLIVLQCCASLFATDNSSPQELVALFDQVVDLGNKGNIAEAVATYANAKRVSASPKEKLEATDRIRSLFDKIREQGIGPVIQTNRISVVYYGDAFCRVRYLNTHDKGYLLWTFYGERVADNWHSVTFLVSANSDLEDLATEKLDPSDASRESLQPQPSLGGG